MRLEILVQDGDVQIYPLNRPKIVIGTGDICDIVISANGVSRKHLFIITENDQYFVVDQGSTNGTFINEERLQPGKKVEFTSFFPVRLGENVLLSLLSDEESDDFKFADFNSSKSDVSSPSIKTIEKSDMTRSISMSDLTNSKTQNLVKKRKEIHNAKAQPKKASAPISKDQSRMTIAKVVAVFLIAGAAYYHFFMKEIETESEKVAVVGEIIKVEPAVHERPSVSLIADADLVPYKNLMTLMKDIKCVNEFEKLLCDNVKNANVSPWGVVQVMLMLNIFVDGSVYLSDARSHVPLPRDKTPENMAKYEKDVRETAIASFLVYGLPESINYELIKDFGLSVALVSPEQEKIEAAAAISHGTIRIIKEELKESDLLEIRSVGIKAIEFTRKLYRVY